MFFGKCIVCEEKDKRIIDLKDQLERRISILQNMITPQYSRAVELEASQALEGYGPAQIPILTEEQKEQLSAVEREALELLTGAYN